MVVRGVPDRIARDGWWLDDADPPTGVRAGLLLIGAIVLADVLLWGFRPGLGLFIWMALIAIGIALSAISGLDRAQLFKASAVLIVAFIPLVEEVQFATVVIALLGLMVFGVMILPDQRHGAKFWRAVIRIPGYGLVQTVRDLSAIRFAVPTKGGFRGAMFDWALPLGAGGLFVILFAAANPLLDQWILAIVAVDHDILPRLERVIFWGLLALMVWPLLRMSAMLPSLVRDRPSRFGRIRTGLVNERSVGRALVIFNLIFAMQTTLDLGYLWGGAALPEGMTYASYAHRGAYPLLVTALLAGVFALMAQPYLGKGSGVRRMLYVWIAQTVLLVISSILRLDLYVDVYGLTRLRFAAFVWMVVVALGLVLIVMQMAGRHTVGWFASRAFGLGGLAIYLCSLVNIDGYIARHNLGDDRTNDYYLCGLGEGAVPAIRQYEKETGQTFCYSRRPYLSQRNDWREWGYRNARLHRSVALMENAQ